ncbi:DUF1177 domain-containing protein [Pyramidobacter sp. SM-530-WT-4B]|uniref:DUF1177 domain-containing protein n=1 Tax=Pyramidobacter porci TaxID=2605789 RepID=A0A6L5YBX7_9BACT|nr:DUF1177 domain-containing protein [Pyramidobacter porci]MCI6259684.1 DUF1177 domain-containing protein [Pyramidobacter sp.]MST55699.1 DUF1177 domain-containing protein [Pyramidobacter porci]
MSLFHTMNALELLDSPSASGESVKKALTAAGVPESQISVKTVHGPKGSTNFVKTWFYGSEGKHNGGTAPTIGIVGRLGGVGARPERIGLVSDGDGAVSAVAVAMKLGDMAQKGDVLKGDVFVSTHICPNSPTRPHDPVPFMGSPINMTIANREEMGEELDAVLSIDTTRGNRIVNTRGFAISPTVKEGWILRVSEDLLEIMSSVTGELPKVFALSMTDITPYGNGLYHLNSILQPCTATRAPVVGVALTSQTTVPGCATGSSQPADIEAAVRFAVETAKAFGEGKCKFYDEEEFALTLKRYGAMNKLQGMGALPPADPQA